MLSVLLGGCVSPSSHVIVGETREPISPDDVRIYHTPPPAYEEVALLDTSSINSWSPTEQEQVDLVIQRLKEEAAKLGANGVILQGVGNQYLVPTAGTATGPVIVHSGGPTTTVGGATTTSSGTVVGGAITTPPGVKAGAGIAIYVPAGAVAHSQLEKRKLEQLETLRKLLTEGVISQTEYETRRKMVLAAQ